MRPRIYTVLRNIAPERHGDYMDRFADGNYIDFHLPFDNRTLPGFLSNGVMRDNFFNFQHHVLSPEARSLEIEGGEHQLIAGSADAHFWPLEMLGQGGFGQVDKVVSRLSCSTYARKRIPRRKDSAVNLRRQNDFVKELEILKKLSHRHLVTYVGSYTDNHFMAYLMRPVAMWNLLEFLNWLGDPLNQARRSQVQPYYGCLASAVGYLHDQSIRHTDITTRNVLVGEQGKIWLSDFGTATDFSQSGRSTTNDLIPISIEYSAPEVAHRQKRNKASDMWSLGVVFLEITTVLLGNNLGNFGTFMAKNAKNRDYPQAIWANLPTALDWLARIMSPHVESANEAITWVRSLLQDDPKNRPTVKNLMVDIRQTPSFRQFCCLDCWDEFDAGKFEFETPLNPEGFNETMKHVTAAEVSARAAALFQPQYPPAPIDADRSKSIEHWIADSTSATVDTSIIPFPHWVENRAVDQYQHLGRLSESTDETENSLSSTIATKKKPRYAKEPSRRPMPGAFPEEDVEIGSGFGYVVEDDRTSDGEDPSPKDEAILAQGFVVEQDSSGSETSDSEVSINLQACHIVLQRKDEPQPLVQVDSGNQMASHRLGELWELMTNDSDQQGYEKDDYSIGLELGPRNRPDCEALAAESGNSLMLHQSSYDQGRRKPRAISERSHDLPETSFSGDFEGFQQTNDGSKGRQLYLTWPSQELESKVPANQALPPPPRSIDEPAHHSPPLPQRGHILQIEYRHEDRSRSLSTASTVSGDVVSENGSDGSGESDTLLTIPSLEMQPFGGTTEPPVPKIMQKEDQSSYTPEENPPVEDFTHEAEPDTLATEIPPKNLQSQQPHRTREKVHWGQVTIEEIPRDSDDEEEPSAGRNEHRHANKQATVEDAKDASELAPEQNRERQDWAQTNYASGFGPSDILPMEPLFVEGPTRTAAPAHQSLQSRAHLKALKKDRKRLHQSSKPKDPSEEAAQQLKRAKRVRKPAPSPTLFMEDARKAGQHVKSIATSQMTSRTKQALAGCNINRWVDQTNKLLERYCARGSATAVRTLLAQKCNPGTKAKPRRGPLLKAIQGASARHSKVVRALLQYDVDVHVVCPRNYNKTPLHLAIENDDNDGYVNMVHDMVFAGVDPNAKDRNGECALEKIFKGPESRGLEKYRLDALALLLLSEAKGGTEVNIRVPATRDTPLHLAVRRRSPMAAAMLLHKGADVNAVNASGMTPLLSAALMWRGGSGGTLAQMAPDDEQMLDLLTSQPGIRLNECAGMQRRTALHHAVVAGVPLAVEILLEKGASLRQRDADGKTAMGLVASGRARETSDDKRIRALLSGALQLKA
ncbi:hypothetical protein MPH_12759 [Macrophomina phaseolina MS6]|uniref:EKC/KEOPS complex subunit BUD32 n=1 Tax=Macrophomina phaseolina (strain MS6) TaxID=1126212 RepID=K2RJ72_MACPH|nr:hypothetical protein MPH_12759 [Macrophomina phaseolina MS6]